MRKGWVITAALSNFSYAKKKIDFLMQVELGEAFRTFRLHDLRRTFRTNLGRLKVRPDIAERLVNHISARTEMEETYDLYTYLPEMREAMEKWETFIQTVCIDLPGILQAA